MYVTAIIALIACTLLSSSCQDNQQPNQKTDTMLNDGIELKFKDGTTVFTVEKVSIWRNQGWVTVEIEGESPPFDRDVHGCGAPMLQASWKSDAVKYEDLAGIEVYIAQAYDEAISDHVTNFYYSSHNDLNECRVKFSMGDDGALKVELTGYAPEDGVHWGDDSGVNVTAKATFIIDTPQIFDQTPKSKQGGDGDAE